MLIRRYEVGLSQYFLKQGFNLQPYIATRQIFEDLNLPLKLLPRTNPTHQFWRYLIEKKRCPVLKRDLFRRFFIPQKDNSWRAVIAKTDYDINLIFEDQNLEN